ncbi:MAG: hypothetical protein OXU75_22215 [Deltaproteobacteria bacterium]|nr:hypothetical protein [Deltaproteobacteria bacterium]
MALGPQEYVALAAIISAMVDVYRLGTETFQSYYYRWYESEENVDRARKLQSVLSTYSDAEIKAIKDRIENCRMKFIAEGDGDQRRRCLCSVLYDVKTGDGGNIADDWANMYEHLKCVNVQTI